MPTYVVALYAAKSPVALFAAVPNVLYAKTFVPIAKPKFVLAVAASVAAVPPFATAIVVPFHIPLVIVPTVVIANAFTLAKVSSPVFVPDDAPVCVPLKFVTVAALPSILIPVNVCNALALPNDMEVVPT